MHGRLKVRSTAEQAARKAKERQEKLIKYKGAMKIVLKKREEKELDLEALGLTGKLLSANSDLYTMWNFRKEILLELKRNSEVSQVQKLCDSELQFTEECLRINPKSYGCWEQRCFVMLNTPSPDWPTELALCNKYLEYDERNFHCWDYRRFVVRNCGTTAEQELQFTTDKIASNFSNFSSWHYRSTLLPLVHPSTGDPVSDDFDWLSILSGASCASQVDSGKLQEEFELAQNAFFTDPNDQSAWFYHRWLMTATVKPSDCLLSVIRLSPTLLCFSTTNSRKLSVEEVDVQVSGASLPILSLHTTPGSGAVWLLELSEGAEGPMQLSLEGNSVPAELEGDTWYNEQALSRTDGTDHSFLQEQFDAINELLELEPENKWVLLALVSLGRTLKADIEQLLGYVDRLSSIDHMRLNYYFDLKTRLRIEQQLPVTSQNLDLSSTKLTYLPCPQYLLNVTTLDLSKNSLRSLGSIKSLCGLIDLNLSDNLISQCVGVSSLRRLHSIDLSNNKIRDSADIKELKKLKSLQTIKMAGNPITQKPSQ